MNSTENAWRKFLKAEGIVEDVPSKDVSLEGKLDVISAQLNQISVDSQRVADVVPELLGDEGVEEALKQEEDEKPDMPGEELGEGEEEDPEAVGEEGEEEAPVVGEDGAELEKDDDAEGTGADIALSEDEEAVGDEDDPEGIFTEDAGDEELAEEAAEDVADDKIEAAEGDAEDKDELVEVADAEAEPDAEGEDQSDDSEDIAEEEESEEDVEESLDKPEEVKPEIKPEAKAEEKKKIVLTKTGKTATGGKIMQSKSKFLAKAEEVKEENVPETIENSADAKVEDSDEIKCADGAATAGSDGVANPEFGGDAEGRDKEETQKFMESMHKSAGNVFAGFELILKAVDEMAAQAEVEGDEETIKLLESVTDSLEDLTEEVTVPIERAVIQKYGVSVKDGAKRGTGAWQADPKARNNPDNACYAPNGIENTKRHDWSDTKREEKENGPRRANNSHGGDPTKARRRAKQRYHELHPDAGYKGKDGKMHYNQSQNLRSTARGNKANRFESDDPRVKGKQGKGNGFHGTSGGFSSATRHRNSDKAKGRSRKKSFLEIYQPGPLAIQKSVEQPATVDYANVPTKQVADMTQVQTHQRPVAKATVNGDIVRPTLETQSIQKNVPMGRGVSPRDATAGDWADYEAYKKRMGMN